MPHCRLRIGSFRPFAEDGVTHQSRLINMKAVMRGFENKVGIGAVFTTIITKPFLVNPNLLPGPIHWRFPPASLKKNCAVCPYETKAA